MLECLCKKDSIILSLLKNPDKNKSPLIDNKEIIIILKFI